MVLFCSRFFAPWQHVAAARPRSRNRPLRPEYKVKLATTKGDVVILVHRDWAPLGADHFYNLVKRSYYDNNAFFRALKGYIVQCGINGDPKVYARWDKVKIKDDPPKVPNKTGTVVFATPSEPNQRTTHIFINIHDNENLDSSGFVPFGEVVLGLDNVMNVYMDYGEGARTARGPARMKLPMVATPTSKRIFRSWITSSKPLSSLSESLVPDHL